uniref:Uncharacterized protein n=1 Tax=Salix viminalis TaxID=40686 RepID=A0A6N2MFW5_SALVM
MLKQSEDSEQLIKGNERRYAFKNFTLCMLILLVLSTPGWKLDSKALAACLGGLKCQGDVEAEK